MCDDYSMQTPYGPISGSKATIQAISLFFEIKEKTEQKQPVVTADITYFVHRYGGGADLTLSNEKMKPGIVKRLHVYALDILLRAGFDVETKDVHIYTNDGDKELSYRTYNVEFINPNRAGYIGIDSIVLNNGWPESHSSIYAESLCE